MCRIISEMRWAPSKPMIGLWEPNVRLVGARGFEPPTSRSRTVRSTRLSHAPN
jgi:hypothetical protein